LNEKSIKIAGNKSPLVDMERVWITHEREKDVETMKRNTTVPTPQHMGGRVYILRDMDSGGTHDCTDSSMGDPGIGEWFNRMRS